MDNKIAIGDLVRSICEALVEYPDQLRVEVVAEEDSSTVQIHAHESDMGKIIGKQGRIAKAIRLVVKAAAIKNNEKVYVEIVE